VAEPYRTRMVVDIEWPDVPERSASEALRASAEEWFRSTAATGAFQATVTEAYGLPDSVEVRVRLDDSEALLWDTDRGDWTDLKPAGEDTHGHRVFKPAPKEG
jgi:hypothetical protein